MANPLNFLIEDSKDPRRDGWYWATVTQADPLRIRLDNEPQALPYTPESLISYAAVGDRVRVVIVDRQPTIVGNTGGGDTGWIPLSITASGFSGGQGLAGKRIGEITYIRGIVTGDFTAGSNYNVLTLPAAPINLRPENYSTRGVLLTTNRRNWIGVQVNTSGAFLLQASETGSFVVSLHGYSFPRV